MLLRSAWVIFAMIGLAFTVRADEAIDPTAEDFAKDNVLGRLARRMEPDLAGKPERLRQYIDFLQSEIGNDKRLFAFHVEPEVVAGDKVRLRGYTEFPETRDALVEYLRLLQFDVDNQIETLPAEELGHKILGFMKAPRSFCYDKPGGRRTSESECLIGEPLFLLRKENGHLLVHTSEGYLGYVRADDVLRVDVAAFGKYVDGPRVRILSDFQVPDSLLIPAGARLKFSVDDDEAVKTELPTGEKIALPKKLCKVLLEPALNVDVAIARAKQLLGTKYKWGGRTSQGVDCSGLVQLAYSAIGLQMPRDSYQQVYAGQLSATRWYRAGLRPGDTLYFLGSEGKIRHTGLYLGDNRFIQAVVPTVRISSLDPNDDDYDAHHGRSFAFAKRLVE